jgi:hypothetical protein
LPKARLIYVAVIACLVVFALQGYLMHIHVCGMSDGDPG